MMKTISLLAFIFVTLFSAACSTSDGLPNCEFVYSDAIKSEFVLPRMQEEVGNNLQFYDLDNPFLYPVKGQTKVVFSPLLIDGWRQATQEVSYVFHFDSCTSELLDYYKREYN